MLNLNKLFPRLSIRSKLAIGFMMVALLPAAALTVVGVRDTIRVIRDGATATLGRDLELAEAYTASVLSSAEAHLEFFARELQPVLLSSTSLPEGVAAAIRREIRQQIEVEAALDRVHLYSADGESLLSVDRDERKTQVGETEAAPYYAWRAQLLEPGQRAIVPVEVREDAPDGSVATIAALAVVRPIHDQQGQIAAVLVGEARAATVFERLETSTPGFTGVTGLVDSAGMFLYHSARKRDWGRLLAVRRNETVMTDFTQEEAGRMLAGPSGTVETEAGDLVAFRRFRLGDPGQPALTLYRAVPIDQLQAPVRSFLGRVGWLALLVAALVLVAAYAGADQFTRPIITMREATARIADRDEPIEVRAETNDEIEDLARDLTRLSSLVATQRAELRALVSEQGRDLERARATLADVVDHSADAIILTDMRGTITAWNQGATRLFEFEPAEAIGQPVEGLIGREGPGIERELAYFTRELGLHGEVVDYETERLTKGRQLVPVNLTLTRVRGPDGQASGQSLIIRDNRQQRQLHDQLRRSERLASVSVLAAGLAHEINTPLAIISNRIEVMQREIDQAKTGSLRADLGVLANHVTRLSEVTGGLLRFAREDDGNEVHLSVGAIAERVASLLERTIVQRRLRLDVNVAEGVPDVFANERAIETVVVNLLVNAADATPPGGVITLSVARTSGEDGVQLVVADTGPGVPDELRERIFEPFFTTKPVGRGTGLGLTVCRSIVERHGGRFVLAPGPGGARFEITLYRDPARFTWSKRVS